MEPEHPRAPPEPSAGAGRLPAAELALAALICFLPSVVAGYVYDDLPLVRDNPYAHGFDQLRHAFTTYFWSIGAAEHGSLRYYRPLVTVTYILNWVMAGGKPWLFHFFNASVHAATTYLVVRIADRWTGRSILALAVGAVFAIHPSRTESVDWIAGRTDVLMTFFLLLAVEATHAGAIAENARRRAGAFTVSASSFVLALLSKEVAVILPLLLLPDALSATDRRERRVFFTSAGGYAAAGAGYLLLRMFVFPFEERGALELTPRYGFFTVFAYAERIVFPWPQTFFHRPITFEHGSYVCSTPLVVGGALLLLGYAALVVTTFRKDRVAAVLLCLAALALGPLLNFTRTGVSVTTSDHFLYLPLPLLLAGLARRYRDVLGAWARVRSVRLGFVGLLAIYLTIDGLRVIDYRDQETLYQAELRLNPENPQALRALSEVRARAGKIDEAYELLARASRPESARYALLLPPWRLYENYLRMLGLMVARTADGSVRDLTLLYRELDALLAGRIDSVHGRVGELVIGRAVTPSLHAYAVDEVTREVLAAEAGCLGARLGDDAHARELLGSLTASNAAHLPSGQNVALAYARLGDFAAARRWLDVLAHDASAPIPEASQASELRRFAAAESLVRRAAATTGVERRVLRAEAFLELGAYLRGLRVLRPAFERDPTSLAVGPLYMHLLIAARLEQEATAVATRALGPERGAALVMETRNRMTDRLKGLRKPEEPSEWYFPRAPGG
jgi:tetratricopeptide (TPR) repeat protein